MSTSSAVATFSSSPEVSFPGVHRFSKLLKLDATWDEQRQVSVLGPRSTWERKLDQLTVAGLTETVENLGEGAVITTTVWGVLDEQQKELRRVMDERKQAAADAETHLQEIDLDIDLLKATMAKIRRDYATARELFDKVFSAIKLADDSVDSQHVADYAFVLAALNDPRAAATVAKAEQKVILLSDAFRAEGQKYRGRAWFVIAEAYALLGQCEASVRCLRSYRDLAPGDTARRLEEAKNDANDAFVSIRGDELFGQLEAELLSELEHGA
jgi:hypothetical protein